MVSVGADAAASRGTAVTASGSTHTKGSYAELVAAMTFHATCVRVIISPGTSHTGYLVDLAAGAAGSEQVIASNLLMESRIGTVAVYELPIHLPAGARLAARCQSATSAGVCYVSAVLSSAPWGVHVPLSRVLTLGANTATSLATLSLDPGAAANTKGAWGQVVASTDVPIRALIPVVLNGNAAYSDADWLIDIGVGAAAAEVVLVPNLPAGSSAAADLVTPSTWPPIPVDVPAGTRIAARSQCSITDASDRKFSFALIGVG
jgi:hypothetical protein